MADDKVHLGSGRGPKRQFFSRDIPKFEAF